MNFDIEKVIKKMRGDKYPLYVSERHLQISFILKAKELYPSYNFIPEYVWQDSETYHIDLMASNRKEFVAFEFKYITAGGDIRVPGNENYPLKNHSATNERRYQCVKDISRLEHYLKQKNTRCNKGYFLLITNMSLLWDGSNDNSTDKSFDIHEGSTLEKGFHKACGYTKFAASKKPIEIQNNYGIKYNDYVDLKTKKGLFKYLAIEVK